MRSIWKDQTTRASKMTAFKEIRHYCSQWTTETTSKPHPMRCQMQLHESIAASCRYTAWQTLS